MAQVFAKLDPSNKNSQIVLSNGDLTYTSNNSPGNWTQVAANQTKTTGKWYYEITCTTGTTHAFFIANSSWDFTLGNTVSGSTANSWAKLWDASKQTNNVNVAYGASIVAGDVIGVAMDVDGGSITMYRNGTSEGVMYNTGLPATVYFGFQIQTSSQVATVNFGATTFAYSVPSGFNAGLYTGSPSPANIPDARVFFM